MSGVAGRRSSNCRQVNLLDQQDVAAQRLHALQAPRSVGVPPIEVHGEDLEAATGTPPGRPRAGL
eukprot:10503374-Alexandrium_andersonii.AAC.1